MSCEQQEIIDRLHRMCNTLQAERDAADTMVTYLQRSNVGFNEELHKEKMRNARVETIMLVIIVLLGLGMVFK